MNREQRICVCKELFEDLVDIADEYSKQGCIVATSTERHLEKLLPLAREALAAPADEQVELTDVPEGYVLMEKTRLQKALLEATVGLIQGVATQLEMLGQIKELEETIAAHEAKKAGGGV